MKTLLVTTAIALSSFLNPAQADTGSELARKIEETVRLDDSILLTNKGHINFVRMSFKVNAEGRIEIIDMNYSDERLKDLLVAKLAKIKIEGQQNQDEVHYYKFSFDRI